MSLFAWVYKRGDISCRTLIGCSLMDVACLWFCCCVRMKGHWPEFAFLKKRMSTPNLVGELQHPMVMRTEEQGIRDLQPNSSSGVWKAPHVFGPEFLSTGNKNALADFPQGAFSSKWAPSIIGGALVTCLSFGAAEGDTWVVLRREEFSAKPRGGNAFSILCWLLVCVSFSRMQSTWHWQLPSTPSSEERKGPRSRPWS